MKKISLIVILVMTIGWMMEIKAQESYQEDIAFNASEMSFQGENEQVRVRKSTSKSNSGKEQSTMTKEEKMKYVQSLAAYKLFGDEYKRKKGCTLEIITSQKSHFCELTVRNNKEIVQEVKKLFEQDKALAKNTIQTYSESREEIIITLPHGVTESFTEKNEGESCVIFISWQF